MTRTLRLLSVLPLVLAAACAATPPSSAPAAPPTPTAAPLPTPENPPDARARMPLRPTPPQPESTFPPPQLSDAAEDPSPSGDELLPGEVAVLLDGAPFPEKKTYDPKFPEARRIRYVAADASGPGDGSQEYPWKDLQEALCRLEPGDRLLLAAGIYEGAFRVAGPCLSGTAGAPIQVFARDAFLKPAGTGDVLTLERAHWQFWEVQIALLDSDSAGLVVIGADAHDIAVDQSHISDGNGPAVRIGPGTARVTLSNCHIHQSRGVRIEAGSSSATLVNNHIHHNRSASVSVGTGEGTAQGVTIEGNRIHDDRGPAVDLTNCENVIVSRNRLSNYRLGDEEADDAGGEAVRVRAGCRDVTFENNSVLEATVALRIGDPEDARPDPPEKISIHHNYFENRLTAESAALRIDRGREVRFSNNVIDRYADPFVIAASGVQRVWIANNLVLEPKTAFTLLSPDAVAVFDYNVFGATPALPAVVAEDRVAASTWIKGHMPHSRLVPAAGLSGRDLNRIVGFSAVDAGSALEGIPFRGKAPDIGVAER